jgi:hypothetical protein
MGSAGDNYQPWPVDFPILELLPEDGVLGGVHWKGRRVKDVVDELRDQDLDVTSDLVASRMRSMNAGGVTIARPAGGGSAKVWARTTKGSTMLRNKEDYIG